MAVKDVRHDKRRAIVDARGGRQVARAGEEQRPVNRLQQAVARELLLEEVADDGQRGADPEEVQQAAVDLARAVHARRPDGAPDDGGLR